MKWNNSFDSQEVRWTLVILQGITNSNSQCLMPNYVIVMLHFPWIVLLEEIT